MGDHYIDIVPVEKTEVQRSAEGRAKDVDVVQAMPNPFPLEGGPRVVLRPGDTVTWNLPPNRKMHVEFLEVQDLPVDSHPSLPLEDPLGPFKSLNAEDGRIVGTLRDDISTGSDNGMQRFYYRLHEEGKKLEWDQKPPGAPSHTLGGGIDVPPRPPGGGSGGN